VTTSQKLAMKYVALRLLSWSALNSKQV